jgi:hypothetical protein
VSLKVTSNIALTLNYMSIVNQGSSYLEHGSSPAPVYYDNPPGTPRLSRLLFTHWSGSLALVVTDAEFAEAESYSTVTMRSGVSEWDSYDAETGIWTRIPEEITGSLDVSGYMWFVPYLGGKLRANDSMALRRSPTSGHLTRKPNAVTVRANVVYGSSIYYNMQANYTFEVNPGANSPWDFVDYSDLLNAIDLPTISGHVAWP